MAQDDHPEERPEGFSKYLKRMKTVLRPRSMSKRQSITPAVVAPAETTAPKATSPPATVSAPVSAPAPAQELSPTGPVMITNYSTTQQEKARTLFAKYGLTVNTLDWKTPPDLQLTRVTKPIRMRVHRTCHRCETTFGAEKVCINCQHTRCTKCPRYPAARNKDGEASTRKLKLPETYVHQPHLFPRTSHLKLSTAKEISLKMPSPTGGQDFVRRPVRQRVHRQCHLCASPFALGSKECPSCSHVRCKICPRDPAKLDKYPDGYPGDAHPPKPIPERTFKKPRRRVHYECHVCETGFQVNSNTCLKCGQVKCAETKRIPPKKVKPEISPEVLKSMEEKLAAMVLEHTPNIVEATA
ncbi:Zinc finger FYVE/PHD-type [Penicillium expansum]|nr:Zinc finger FYVE/PHD-type [Penicillium expansum]